MKVHMVLMLVVSHIVLANGLFFNLGKPKPDPKACECRLVKNKLCQPTPSQVCETIEDKQCVTEMVKDCRRETRRQCTTSHKQVCKETITRPVAQQIECIEETETVVENDGSTYLPTLQFQPLLHDDIDDGYGAPQAGLITSSDIQPVTAIDVPDDNAVVPLPEDTQSRSFNIVEGIFGGQRDTPKTVKCGTYSAQPAEPIVTRNCATIPVEHCRNMEYPICNQRPETKCETRPRQVCRPTTELKPVYVDKQECGVLVKVIETETREMTREQCENRPRQQCQIVYEERCANPPPMKPSPQQVETRTRHVCETTYRHECNTPLGQPGRQCRTVEDVQCTIPTYEKPQQCTPIQRQECYDVQPVCQTVPVQNCHNIVEQAPILRHPPAPIMTRPICQKVPRQVCQTINEVKCEPVVVPVPCPVEKERCIWPESDNQTNQLQGANQQC